MGKITPITAVLETRSLGVSAGAKRLLHDIDLSIHAGRVFAIIGESGAGKSTLLRCLNRLSELDPILKREGDILFHGKSILSPDVDVDALRARIASFSQQPAVFPVSIQENVLFAALHVRRLSRLEAVALAERALREAALWDEVKDRLQEPAANLSVGQQQQLCLARTLALDPEVLLMDEPTSSLDILSTAAIEDLILKLKTTHTIVLATKNLNQARRIVDIAAFLHRGEIIECGPCEHILGRAFIDPSPA
jgi:phosphate transport system ATP-binding protein